jgi:hypothetical protein
MGASLGCFPVRPKVWAAANRSKRFKAQARGPSDAVGRSGCLVSVNRVAAGCPGPSNIRTRSAEAVAGDVDFPKSTPGASRRRRRRGDAWGVVLGHFARRLTSHFRAGYCHTSHDQVANSVDFGAPPRPHCSRDLRYASVVSRRRFMDENAIAIGSRRAERLQNRLAAHCTRRGVQPSATRRRSSRPTRQAAASRAQKRS